MEYILFSKDNYFFQKLKEKLETNINQSWVFLTEKKYDFIETKKPAYIKIFFLHWNYIVPEHIFKNYECINIHTSNLPEGKGGSPIQNQIIDNIKHTRVNALKMTNDGLDAGPIYCSKNISLQGNIFDIWNIITETAYLLINEIINNNLKPIEQEKSIEKIYKRRKDNSIPFDEETNIEKIYDFIRMLDSNDYPDPYIIVNGYKLSFNRAKFNGKNILSDVIIEKFN
jgi:methionyl-tRNA formyltransferase